MRKQDCKLVVERETLRKLEKGLDRVLGGLGDQVVPAPTSAPPP